MDFRKDFVRALISNATLSVFVHGMLPLEITTTPAGESWCRKTARQEHADSVSREARKLRFGAIKLRRRSDETVVVSVRFKGLDSETLYTQGFTSGAEAQEAWDRLLDFCDLLCRSISFVAEYGDTQAWETMQGILLSPVTGDKFAPARCDWDQWDALALRVPAERVLRGGALRLDEPVQAEEPPRGAVLRREEPVQAEAQAEAQIEAPVEQPEAQIEAPVEQPEAQAEVQAAPEAQAEVQAAPEAESEVQAEAQVVDELLEHFEAQPEPPAESIGDKFLRGLRTAQEDLRAGLNLQEPEVSPEPEVEEPKRGFFQTVRKTWKGRKDAQSRF